MAKTADEMIVDRLEALHHDALDDPLFCSCGKGDCKVRSIILEEWGKEEVELAKCAAMG